MRRRRIRRRRRRRRTRQRRIAVDTYNGTAVYVSRFRVLNNNPKFRQISSLRIAPGIAAAIQRLPSSEPNNSGAYTHILIYIYDMILQLSGNLSLL
jgi:hypothetical protein